MPYAADTLADTSPEIFRFYYRPIVEFEKPDFAFALGDYRFMFFSDGMRSTGAINYKYILVALDTDDQDVLYVTAETNDREGETLVYLGHFTPQRHTTFTRSPAFVHREFFFAAACMVAREALNLPYEEFPMLQIEDDALGDVPKVFERVFPGGGMDEETQKIMGWMAEGVMRSM